jgi:membrane protease YdiL (CAAX protease family)
VAIEDVETRPAISRGDALLQILVVVVLIGMLVSVMSVYDTIGAGFWSKALLVGRMAFLVLLCTWFLRCSRETWADLGLRRPLRWWILPVLVVGGFSLLVLLSSVLRFQLLPALGVPPSAPRPTSGLQGNWSEYLFYATFVSWGSAAIGEELLLRGFVLDRLLKIFGSSAAGPTLGAILLQAAVFGTFHLHQGADALIAAAGGAVLGLVWLLGGRNLWACIILHGLIDTVTYWNYYKGPGDGL